MYSEVHYGISPDYTITNRIARFLDNAAITAFATVATTDIDGHTRKLEFNLNQLDTVFKAQVVIQKPYDSVTDGQIGVGFNNSTGSTSGLLTDERDFEDVDMYLFSDETSYGSIFTVMFFHHTPVSGFDFRGFFSFMVLPLLEDPSTPAAAVLVSSFRQPEWRDVSNNGVSGHKLTVIGSNASFNIDPEEMISGPDVDSNLHVFNSWAALYDQIDGILHIPDFWFRVVGKETSSLAIGTALENVPSTDGDKTFYATNIQAALFPELDSLNNASKVTEYHAADHSIYEYFLALIRIA